ncbi:ribose 5-phosphate isomerase B [Lactiplantibacillus plantarum]|uniref:ribose 5-phosphate isomerase B n=1 Tax=Lactiplantibacillus plantarum TaxID=1590 RepID=UPI001BA5B1D7|nr:ribose 5-phosphate isomerase B [Lactiplantibacillus plantarum]MBS0937588.1 ribose 5-phosphate isomerase B [Lactiplantibacillus plantarum]MBS0945558.1 ribose 5-phosphate isomerase B [Lactiplantibacillus plantarum]
MTKIAIGSDHVGIELKPVIIDYLQELGYDVTDFGTKTTDRTDYPIYGKKVGEAVASGDYDLGILICGTGVGISLAANKVNGIRAVVCSEPYSAQLSRQHNNTNVLAFGSRVVGAELAKMIVKSWLDASFIGGRHLRRVDELGAIEAKDDQKFVVLQGSTSSRYTDD